MIYWPHVLADLAQFFGVYLHQHESAPWPWLYHLIYGLVNEPDSRLARLFPPN